MPLLLIEYTELVIKAYHDLKNKGSVSNLLSHPTTLSLRQACLNVYIERRNKDITELNPLQDFFGVLKPGEDYAEVIQGFNVDKFRPLRKFILGEIKNPSSVTVELLAWLIDFTPRPLGRAQAEFEKKKTLFKEQFSGESVSVETESIVKFSGDKEKDATDEVTSQYNESEKKHNEPVYEMKSAPIFKDEQKSTSIKKWFIAGIIVLFILLSGAFYWAGFIREEQCMYWKDDHYERVDCDAEVNDKVAFDEDRWKNFRKITDLSSINEKSIGVVHYYGNKNREFYTSGGKHPIETTRHVKVMTRYIWEKEFGAKDSTTKDSAALEIKKPILHQ